MFTVQQYGQTDSFIVHDMQSGDNLHSDGSIYKTAEYFPTRKIAQAVLDKYRPQHEWKHGDIFVNHTGTSMIYLVIDGAPRAHCLDICTVVHEGENLDGLLTGAKFLFNVNDGIGGNV